DEHGGKHRDAPGRLAPDPDQRRDERDRVGRDVREQRAERDLVPRQPAALVARLPVGLEQVVTHHVGDEEAGERVDPAHFFFLRARYCLPARTMTVLCLTKSLTVTTPLTTRVSVPSQRSMISHLVPRTVAELNWPRVRNCPAPSPHSLRVLGFFAA